MCSEGYGTWSVCVCLSVFLSVYSHTKGWTTAFERYAVKTSEKANMHNRPEHAQFAEGLHFRKVIIQRKMGKYEWRTAHRSSHNYSFCPSPPTPFGSTSKWTPDDVHTAHAVVGFNIARGIQLTGCVVFSIVAIPAGGSAYSINESARAVSPISSSQYIISLIFIGSVLCT